MNRMRVALWLAASVAVSAFAPAQAPTVEVRILAPADGSYVTGATNIRATVTAPPERVASVVFFADGTEVCRVTKTPYECPWNAGSVVKAHDIRVVANLAGSGRVVGNVHTKGTTYADKVDVPVVQITATVSDGGHFIRGLPQTAFHVFEDGAPQPVTGFATSDVPLDLVVAVDISGSMGLAMPQVKAAVKEFLKAVPAKDHVTLLGFNDRIFTLARSVTDPAERAAAVDRLAPWGLTALYDVIEQSLDLVGQQPGRKALIVFTDGEDQGSHVTLDQVQQRVEESDATVFMIGEGRGSVADRLKKILTRLAEPTGGRAIFNDDLGHLRTIFGELLDELSNQYLLSYPPATSKPGAWHQIEVKVDGYRHVRARQGYRTPPDGGSVPQEDRQRDAR